MYKAVLFARDGDWVTDFSCKTKEEVWERISNMGSRWYFYPIIFLIRDFGFVTTPNQRIIDTPEGWFYEEFKGRRISTVSKAIANLTDSEYQSLLEG